MSQVRLIEWAESWLGKEIDGKEILWWHGVPSCDSHITLVTEDRRPHQARVPRPILNELGTSLWKATRQHTMEWIDQYYNVDALSQKVWDKYKHYLNINTDVDTAITCSIQAVVGELRAYKWRPFIARRIHLYMQDVYLIEAKFQPVGGVA